MIEPIISNWDVIVTAISAFITGMVVYAKVLTTRLTEEEARAIYRKGYTVYREYKKAKAATSAGGTAITNDEMLDIMGHGADFVKTVFESLALEREVPLDEQKKIIAKIVNDSESTLPDGDMLKSAYGPD